MSFPPGDTDHEDIRLRAIRYTLKEAAQVTGRSVTTLRRYIRMGKLKAEKAAGRYGPEYTLDEPSLLAAGFEIQPRPAPSVRPERNADPQGGRFPLASREVAVPAFPSGSLSLEKMLQDFVPADLYRELAMKHEQLLVQYGMIRASGQRMFEFRDEAEQATEALEAAEERIKQLQDRSSSEISFLKRHLRQAELEIEGKNTQILSLVEKVRTLELLTRNAITNESIEQQFLQIFEKEKELDTLMAGEESSLEPSPASEEEGNRRIETSLDRWLKPGLHAANPPDLPDH